MKKRCIVVTALVFTTLITSPVFADDESPSGVNEPTVVGEEEACPSGMVVSGLTGGQGDVSKVCVPPNSPSMTNDVDEVE